MSFAHNQASVGGNSGATNVSSQPTNAFGSNILVGDLIVFAVIQVTASTPTWTIADNGAGGGNTYVQIGATYVNGSRAVAVFSCNAATIGGALTVTAGSTVSAPMFVSASDYTYASGATLTISNAQFSAAAGGSQSTSNFSWTTPNALLYGVIADHSAGGSVGSNFALQYYGGGGSSGANPFTEDWLNASPSPQAVTATIVSSAAMFGVCFAEVPRILVPYRHLFGGMNFSLMDTP